MSLRETIITELTEISGFSTPTVTACSAAYLPPAYNRFVTLVNSVFQAINIARQEQHYVTKDWLAAVAAVFGTTMPDADDIRYRTPLIIALNGENIEITRSFEIWKTLPPRKEEVTKWVQVDANTRRREVVLDGAGKPKMKKIDAETVSENASAIFSFPISFFEDLLTEIGQDSLTVPPGLNYIPDPLGVNLKKVLGALAQPFPPFLYDEPLGGWGRGGYGGHPMLHPVYRVQYESHAAPFRMFLKPEAGSDRLEVIVEPYPEDEVKANRKLIRDREHWLKGDVSDTRTVDALCARIVAKYTETREAKKKGEAKK